MHMELVGEEKRIQALFSEARLADEQTMPSFVGVWNRAQSQTMRRPHRAFNLSFVAATALLVCALVSLAWWVNHSQRNAKPVVAVALPTAPVGPVPAVENAGAVQTSAVVQSGIRSYRSDSKSRAIKLAARRQAVLVAANKKAVSDAKAIESWQSPTATLLDSSSDELLKSLPQLNQTVNELKSFLPAKPK